MNQPLITSLKVETTQREFQQLEAENGKLKVSLSAEQEHSAGLEAELKKIYDERVDMAKKCVDKDDEMTGIRRLHQESEEKMVILQNRNDALLRENLEMKDLIGSK